MSGNNIDASIIRVPVSYILRNNPGLKIIGLNSSVARTTSVPPSAPAENTVSEAIPTGNTQSFSSQSTASTSANTSPSEASDMLIDQIDISYGGKTVLFDSMPYSKLSKQISDIVKRVSEGWLSDSDRKEKLTELEREIKKSKELSPEQKEELINRINVCRNLAQNLATRMATTGVKISKKHLYAKRVWEDLNKHIAVDPPQPSLVMTSN